MYIKPKDKHHKYKTIEIMEKHYSIVINPSVQFEKSDVSEIWQGRFAGAVAPPESNFSPSPATFLDNF